MDRTLFTPSMIEAFRACKRAYKLAYLDERPVRESASSICKSFVLRGLAEVNRGRLTSATHVQKFMGLNWPLERLSDQPGGKDTATRAFLFVYKALLKYAANPYRPAGAETVSVATRVRARVAGQKLYLEDVFDLILWYPEEKKLELVIFHLKPLRKSDPAWPTATTLVRQHLAERLKVRWPFEKLVLTTCKISPGEQVTCSTVLEESLYNIHWPDLVKSLDEMKELQEVEPHEDRSCTYCQSVESKWPNSSMIVGEQVKPASLTA